MAVDYSRLILAPKATDKLAQPKDKEHLFHPYVDLAPNTLRFLFSNPDTDPVGATDPNGFYNSKAMTYINSDLAVLYRPMVMYDVITSTDTPIEWTMKYGEDAKLNLNSIYKANVSSDLQTTYNNDRSTPVHLTNTPYEQVNVTGLYRRFDNFLGNVVKPVLAAFNDEQQKLLTTIVDNRVEQAVKTTPKEDILTNVLNNEYIWNNDTHSSGASKIITGTWKKVDDGTNRNVWDWTYGPSNGNWSGAFKGMFTHIHNTDVKVIAAGDLSGIVDMAYMFQNCDALSYVCPLDTSNVVRFKFMFCDCNNLLRLPELDISNANTLEYFAGRNVMQNSYGSVNYEEDYLKRSETLVPSKITNIPVSYSEKLPLKCYLQCAFKGLDHAIAGFNPIAKKINNENNMNWERNGWAFGCKKADYSEFSDSEIVKSGVTETFKYDV